jgi:hypothetical protein
MFLLRLLIGLLCWGSAAAACAAEGATHRLIIHFKEVRLRAAQMPDADAERALGVSAGMRVRGLRPMSGGAPVIFPIATQSVAPGASLSFTVIAGMPMATPSRSARWPCRLGPRLMPRAGCSTGGSADGRTRAAEAAELTGIMTAV